jgi:hypothetical protein
VKSQSLIYTPPAELIQMEQGILGVLLSGEEIPGFFEGQMFYSKKHLIIYKAATDLQTRGISPDILSVSKSLGETGQIEDAGGTSYVASLTNYVLLKDVVFHYAKTIAAEYERRKVTTALVKALEEIGKNHGDTAWIVQNVITELSAHREDAGRKTEWTAAELKTHEFPDVQWVVPDLVTAGLSVLCGAPKVKKSWLALSMAVGVASGGAVLGKIPVQKQGVLYLALEDSPRRLQDRMNKLNMGYPENLHFFTEWKTGVAGLKSYLQQRSEIKLCIIDTWGIFSPHRDQNDYSESTMRAHELKAVADELGVSILLIHHAKKGGNYGDGGDWLDSILGSTGLAGAVDSIILLKRKRGEEKAELLATGRDILEKDMILSFDLDCGGWIIEGDKQSLQEGETQQEVYDWLKENGAHTPKEIHKGLKEEGYGGSPVMLRVILSKMADKGALKKEGHIYSVKVTEYKNTKPLPDPLPLPESQPDIPDGITPAEYRECYNAAYSVFIGEGLPPDGADRKARGEIRRFIAGYNPPVSGAAVIPFPAANPAGSGAEIW